MKDRAEYYDPMFYICSEEMPFTIRVDAELKDDIDGAALSRAVNTAIKRYPYFAVRVAERGGELLCEPNPLPVVVYEGDEVRPLGGESVNHHLFALSYSGRRLRLFASHVICDGAGCFPFILSLFFYYITLRFGAALDPLCARTIDTPMFPDELGNPFPEERMADAVPFYKDSGRPFFRLRDGGLVNDEVRTVYRFRVREEAVMRYNYDNDGSPCALFSSLMTRAVWELHPDVHDDIVSAVSFNLRPALGCAHSYRMLCSYIPVRYPERLRGAPVSKMCTCSRGQVTLHSQPENVLAYARRLRENMTALLRLDGVRTKCEALAPAALADATNNTFSVSFVGKIDWGEMEPYIVSMYNTTDGATWKSVFIEIAQLGGWFYIAVQQGFSSDVYYRALLRQLGQCGLEYIEEGSAPLGTPRMDI